jgi:hypothetical protein
MKKVIMVNDNERMESNERYSKKNWVWIEQEAKRHGLNVKIIFEYDSIAKEDKKYGYAVYDGDVKIYSSKSFRAIDKFFINIKEVVDVDVRTIISKNAYNKFMKYGVIVDSIIMNFEYNDQIIRDLREIKQGQMDKVAEKVFNEYSQSNKKMTLDLIQYFSYEFKRFMEYDGEKFVITYKGKVVTSRKCNSLSISFYR